MRSVCVWAAISPALFGCGAETPAPVPQRPTQTAGAFTMMISPMEGRAAIVQQSSAVYYTGWSTATKGTGPSTVTPSTDQNGVSYVDSNGVCRSNMGSLCNVATTGANRCSNCTTCNACNGMLPSMLPCATPGTFCAPSALVSNFSYPLPDVVVQLANRATDMRNSIRSCSDSAFLGGGQCAQDSANAAKVDSSTSSLTSPVAGCSYCYSNRATLTSANLGLRDALLPGASAHNVDKFALNLSNANAFGIDGLIEYAAPTIDSVSIDDVGVPASCATINITNVKVTGGGFGPPGGCMPNGCAVSGIPGSGYVLDFVRQTGMGGGTPFGPIANTTIWSDKAANATLGTTTVGSTCVARITTPSSGTSALSPTFSVCSGHGNLDHFGLVVLTPTPVANGLLTFTLVAQDSNNARVTNTTGAVTLTMTRNGSTMSAGNFVFVTPNANPANYSWVGADNGGHIFTNGARAGMSGSYRITATQGAVTGSVDFTVD